MDLFEEVARMRRAGRRGALAARGRCAIRLRLVISKSQRTRDTCLQQQGGLSSFLMSTLFRIVQTPGFVAASMLLGCTWRWWNEPGVPRGVQEIIL